MKLFFVCDGNSCRSVIAQNIFKEMLKKRGISTIEVLSRGLDVRHSGTISYTDRVMREEYGVDVSKHVPKELNKEEGLAADLILTMTNDQKKRAIYYGWATPDKIFMLSEYVGEDEAEEIKDPYGLTIEHYRETARRIERYLQRLADRLLSQL